MNVWKADLFWIITYAKAQDILKKAQESPSYYYYSSLIINTRGTIMFGSVYNIHTFWMDSSK